LKPSNKSGLLFLLFPALAIYLFAVVAPFIGTLGLSFFRWDGYAKPIWAGFDNYVRAFKDQVFQSTFAHVLIYILVTLIVEVLLGLILAGYISSRRNTTFLRISLFIPVMLPSVVIAVLWSAIYNPDYGILNSILADIGLANLQHVWLGDPTTALLSICLVSGWVYSGFFMAIFVAAFSRLPSEVIESASLDGAGAYQIFRKIKVPMIQQSTSVAILLCITGGVQGFDLFYVMTNGGPYNTTEVPTTYLVKTVFANGEIGYGSALAILISLVGLFAALGFRTWQSRKQEELEY
jgi:raffinose/stachyose/melibiose transport system permease protein